jgi:hypothetical protein
MDNQYALVVLRLVHDRYRIAGVVADPEPVPLP